jgi:hypothetical protein
MEERRVYLQWVVDVIVADHDGYCIVGENEEEISMDTVWCSYYINEDEFNTLTTLNTSRLYDLFNNVDHLTKLAPSIPNDDVGVKGGGSGYCGASEHGLYHERKRIPVEVISITFERPDTDELLAVNPLPLQRFLHTIKETNSTVDDILRPLYFPVDVIKLLWRYIWNIQ